MRKKFKYRFEDYDILSFRMLLTAYPDCTLVILIHPTKKVYKLRLFPNCRPIGIYTSYDSVEFTEFSLVHQFLNKL